MRLILDNSQVKFTSGRKICKHDSFHTLTLNLQTLLPTTLQHLKITDIIGKSQIGRVCLLSTSKK